MSTTPAISSASAMQDLAARITKRYDTNGDGSLSVNEFAGFLSNLTGMGGTTATTAGKTGAGASTSTSHSSSTSRTPVDSMPAFDGGKLADTSHKTVKYEIARILQYFPHTPAGLQAALPEIQAEFPSVTIKGSKGDLLDFGDYTSNGEKIGVVDVIFAAGEGGLAWQWGPVA